MKNQLQKCTVIKSALFAALLMAGGAAWAAQVAGVVARLSGPLMVKKADGSVKVLALRSEIESGDTLVSEKNTYAQIKFIDNSEITLKPGTTFTIEAFAYEAARPEGDSASFSLLKGGLRSVSGLLGKRNREKFSLKTPTATIGIRGTTFIAQYVPVAPVVPAAPGAVPRATPVPPAGAGGLAAGLYVAVTDGMILVANKGGTANFSAGQFGFTASVTMPPVIIPNTPKLQFTPPPAFQITPVNPQASSPPKANGVDCEVR